MLKLYSTSGSAIAPIRRRWRVADLTEETTMTGPESLLARWSRRKSDARTSEGDAGSARHDSEAFATRSGVTQSSDVPPPFDLASLPTLDSISGKTDLRAFLGKGVPAELTVAALRRGWSADPALWSLRKFSGCSPS